MNKKILVSAAVLAALTAPAAGSVQAASILRSVGTHPVSAPLASVEDLKAMMREMGGDIQAGMAAAGHSDLFPLLQAHIANYPRAQISVVEYLPGQRIDWMLFRRYGKGRIKVARDVTWRGKGSLNVFEFSVDKNGQRYVFAVPLQCGNLALKEFGPAPAPVVQPIAPVIQQVPGPTVYVPKEVIREVRVPVHVPGPTVYVDRPVVRQVPVHVPGPTVYVDRPVVRQVPVHVPGPTVYVPKEVIKYVDKPVVKEVKVPVTVVKYVDKPVEVIKQVHVPGPTRTVVKRVTVQGPTRTVYIDRPVVKVKTVKTEAKCCDSPFHFIADGGYLSQDTNADYGFGRLGVEYVFNPQFSFLALAGGAGKTDGKNGEDALLLDFMVQYNLFQCSANGAPWSPLFIGIGVGAWMTNGEDEEKGTDSNADLIAEAGLRLFGTPATTSMAIFIEGRAATDELNDMDKYGRIGGGLRFRF